MRSMAGRLATTHDTFPSIPVLSADLATPSRIDLKYRPTVNENVITTTDK